MSSEKPFSIKDVFNIFKEKTPRPAKGQYIYPFIHSNPQSVTTENDLRTHKGSFNGAIDFIIDVGTKVIASDNGIVVKVVDGNTEYGDNPEFTNKANYITIFHPQTQEYSQYIHLANGTTLVTKGDTVSQGQTISQTGLSGFMDKPHLHFFVFKQANNQDGFIGLKPRFKTPSSTGSS